MDTNTSDANLKVEFYNLVIKEKPNKNSSILRLTDKTRQVFPMFFPRLHEEFFH